MGNTIRAFASDNATVVIGTSLDPDMNDELRVTVVATGIGMDKRPEITLVTNKQVQQPVMDRYQQHGMSPLTQEQKPAAKVGERQYAANRERAGLSGYPSLPA
ncbi:cell division protein FtsZ [Klebsiella pneumoniae]|uniref:Cell division protein FtsZ n=1 Tax=Klebsiella pneumoniae TaxID=573 RepID=A0A447RZJ8_KLEPN|nr:cell division protein FtsZ [Klebsiella pneumoniae]